MVAFTKYLLPFAAIMYGALVPASEAAVLSKREIVITNPHTGVVFNHGEFNVITWSAGNPEINNRVAVLVRDHNNRLVAQLTLSVDLSVGALVWNIDDTVPCGDGYKVILQLPFNGAAPIVSDPFSIRGC